MNEEAIKEWFSLPEKTRGNIFNEISSKIGLPPAAIEKDWWVVRTLELVFQTDIGPYTVFKGGTSLSKAWGLIERFSEDIDLALDKSFFKFNNELTKAQIEKLRKKSFNYINDKFLLGLKEKFQCSNFHDFEIVIREGNRKNQDPLVIEVNYQSITDIKEYIQSRVLIEIGSRSMREPFSEKSFCSLVGGNFKDNSFADKNIIIPTVRPERTFLEKIFLLHEEYQKPPGKIHTDRLSRHLYDIEKIMDTQYGKDALNDEGLYCNIVQHRKMLNPIRYVNYDNHTPAKIQFIPPDSIIENLRKDYELMKQNMIYGDALKFDELIERLKSLNKIINSLKIEGI